MPRLPRDVPARDLICALQRAGFAVDRQTGSHITLIRESPKARVTVPNHKAIKSGMLKRILNDTGLSVEQFIELL
jgi:predicted RNA binding protein YcfA (HicA-like mRNA interferase family)